MRRSSASLQPRCDEQKESRMTIETACTDKTKCTSKTAHADKWLQQVKAIPPSA